LSLNFSILPLGIITLWHTVREEDGLVRRKLGRKGLKQYGYCDQSEDANTIEGDKRI